MSYLQAVQLNFNYVSLGSILFVFLAVLLALSTACSPVSFQENRLKSRFDRLGLSEHTFENEDVVLHYWKGGDGPPVLLLHGFGANGLWTWHPQVDALIAEHQLIIPDLVWFGGSRAKSAEYSLEFQAQSFLKLLEHEGIHSTDLVGISYGGLVVFQMLAQQPEILDRLVIVDSPGPVFTNDDQQAMMKRMNVNSAADVVIPESADDVQKLFRLAYYKPPKLPKFLIKDTYNKLFTDYVEEKHALLAYLENNRDTLTQVEWKIEQPTLLIWGAEDPLFPVEIGTRLAERIGQNAHMHVIPKARHAPNIEHPKAFNEGISDFLRR